MKIKDFYKENPKFRLSPESLDSYAHVIDEEIDSLDETRGDEEGYVFTKKDLSSPLFDLSSFKPQTKLNERVWVNGRLNSKIRLRLLDIADDFIKSLDVNWATPSDIILTGSLANYNWSKFSDFDLHVLYDFNDVDDRVEFVKEYFDAKKSLWNSKHENLKIYGFPVELYVQDENEKHTSSGVYSVEKDKWLVKPEKNKIKAIKLNKFFIKEKVFDIVVKIDGLIEQYENAKDEHAVEVVSEKAKALFDRIKRIRKDALKNGTEMSTGNIIFKVLRRIGYIEKLVDLKLKTYDKINSIA